MSGGVAQLLTSTPKQEMGEVIWCTDDEIGLRVANKKTLLSAIWKKKGLIIWEPSWAITFLLIGEHIQYGAYPTTAHSVQLRVATVGTRYGSKLLVLKVQEPRHAWTCRSNFSTFILRSWAFYATELMPLHNPTSLHPVIRSPMPDS